MLLCGYAHVTSIVLILLFFAVRIAILNYTVSLDILVEKFVTWWISMLLIVDFNGMIGFSTVSVTFLILYPFLKLLYSWLDENHAYSNTQRLYDYYDHKKNTYWYFVPFVGCC